MKKLSMLLMAVCFMGSVAAQQNPMMAPIPADTEVRKGTLENGMTYYIRHNEKPKGQADFYILHNVGAIQEDDSQQGLAHFLEHMAFNGTKNLPGKQLIEYLETVGVKFGYNLNASTGWDQTTYLITDVPTTRQGVIDSAMLILHDWSHFIALQPEEIDSERGVIKEELRTRDGAQWRSTMNLIKHLGKDSKYAERNLIGYLEGLQNFKHSELEDFYAKWYRPDYQAVVIVGDIDVDAVEDSLKTLMSDIPAPAADAAQKEVVTVPGNEAPIVSVFTDPEMQGSNIQFFIKRPAMPAEMNGTMYGALMATVQAYIVTMEDARLQEIAMKPDAPFLGGGMASGDVLGIIPSMETTAFFASTQDGKLAAGFEAIYTELEKIRRHGFTAGEFERAQNDLMRSAERQYANRNDRRNAEYANVYLKNYSKNAPMPDAETEWQIDSMLIKSLSLNDINAVAKQLLTAENQVIICSAPEKEGVVNPTVEEILAIRDKVIASEIEAYADNTVKEPLIPEGTVLKGSPVKMTEIDDVLGATVWTLKNGVTVVVKPTQFKADEIRLSAESEGGLSLLTDEEYYMGELMPSANAMSGVGKFSATELAKQLSGKTATIRTGVGEYSSRMSGVCSPKDIETMLQLLYLNFTSPRFDENDYNTLMKMARAQLENAKSNPDYVMQETFTDEAYGHNPRRQMLSLEQLDKFSFEALPAIYKKLYGNANGFTFLFVGNVDLTTLRPLVEKYIGSLPVAKQRTLAAEDNCYPVQGGMEVNFTTPMQQPKVSVRYLISGDMPYTLKDKAAFSFLSEALKSRYLVSIREEKGGTYGVQVWSESAYLPTKGTYKLNIAFDTNEEQADELCEIIMKEIRKIAEEGPLAEDIEKTREFQLKNWANSLEQNGGWLGYVSAKYGSGLDYITDYEQVIRSLTYDDVKAMAAKLLADGNITRVVMRPEKVEAAPAE